jgi:hypothetical protein
MRRAAEAFSPDYNVCIRYNVHYAEAFPEEISAALAENDAVDLKALKRMLPQAEEFSPRSMRKR